jgi:S1-C subfamily serine protease
MKNIILITLFASVLNFGSAQLYYTIKSDPDSCVVKVNGQEVGHTPYRHKYNWGSTAVNNEITFSVEGAGYATWLETLTKKPKEFNQVRTVVLEREFKKVNYDSSDVVIAFDKLLADFAEGRKIGEIHKSNGTIETMKWEGSSKVGDKDFETRFYDIASNMGLQTPITKNNALFAGEDSKKPMLPKYIIGAQIVDLNVTVRFDKKDKLNAGSYISTNNIKIIWKVLDKTTDKVVYSFNSENTVKSRNNSLYYQNKNLLSSYESTLMDLFNDPKFIELIKNSKKTSTSTDNAPASEALKMVISPIKTPAFKNQSEMIKHASEGCVTIVTDAGHGSGVIFDARGYILTAYHVLEGVNKIKVVFASGIELDAVLVSSSPKNDLAIIKIPGKGFKALALAADEVTLGDEVLTIGTPADVDLGQSIAKGMISGKRSIEELVYLQINMAVSPGNSGGPLINDKGEIIGIIQKKMVGKGIEGIGFAVPVETIKTALNIEVK